VHQLSGFGERGRGEERIILPRSVNKPALQHRSGWNFGCGDAEKDERRLTKQHKSCRAWLVCWPPVIFGQPGDALFGLRSRTSGNAVRRKQQALLDEPMSLVNSAVRAEFDWSVTQASSRRMCREPTQLRRRFRSQFRNEGARRRPFS
jgi:hypothetical protein